MTGAAASQAEVEHHCIRLFCANLAAGSGSGQRGESTECLGLGWRADLSRDHQHTGGIAASAQRHRD